MYEQSSRGGRKGRDVEGQEEEEEEDFDDVFQYHKTGVGAVFTEIENAIRCHICRAISDPPMSLPCCPKVYCSLCIRQYLDSINPRCPQCRRVAAPDQLKMSTQLRSVCSIWTRNRKTILAAAVASAEADAKAGGGGVAPVVAEEASSRRPGVGSGEGEPAGRLTKGVYYHGLKDSKMRELLRKAGLPSDGNKETMMMRHKRLVLLDDCNADREVRQPRSELIKEVKKWEREQMIRKAAAEKKKREENREDAKRAALAALSPTLPAMLGAAGAGAGAGGQEKDMPDTRPRSVESQQHFRALLENAKRKRKSTASSNGACADGDGGGGKQRRVWREPEDEDDVPAAVANGTVGSGSAGSYATSSVGSDAAGTGAVSNDAVVSECVVTPTPERPPLMVNPTGAVAQTAEAAVATGVAGNENMEGSPPVPGSSQRNADGGDAAEMQILGVAGKMVRTRGPWRGVFSRGALTSGARRSDEGGACTAKEGPPTPATSADNPGSSGPASAVTGREGCLLLPPSSSSLSSLTSGVAGEGAGTAVVEAVSGGGEKSGGDDTLSVGCHEKTEAVSDAERGGGGGGSPSSRRGDTPPADAPPLEEMGMVYYNTATGESAREPPAELVAQAEEADKAGGYLIFVPCRKFVAAMASSSAAAANSSTSTPRVLEAAFAAGSGVGPLLRTAGRSNATRSSGDVRKPAEGRGRGEGGNKQNGLTLNVLSTPAPLVAVDESAAQGGDCGGSGGGAGMWDRLSVVSTGTTPSHPCVPLPTIDLSQGAPARPLLVGNDAGGGSGGRGCSGKDEVTVVDGGAGTKAAEDTWACVACTLKNGVHLSACEVCGEARPKTFRSQRLAQASSSYSSAPSGRGSRRTQSRLRLPTQRANGDNAPQGMITSFTSRSESAVKNGSNSSTTQGSGDGKDGNDGCETK